jgi:hypothetical protein
MVDFKWCVHVAFSAGHICLKVSRPTIISVYTAGLAHNVKPFHVCVYSRITFSLKLNLQSKLGMMQRLWVYIRVIASDVRCACNTLCSIDAVPFSIKPQACTLYTGLVSPKIMRWQHFLSRPFNYMFFTPLYGVRNTGCPQISTNKCPKIATKKIINR